MDRQEGQGSDSGRIDRGKAPAEQWGQQPLQLGLQTLASDPYTKTPLARPREQSIGMSHELTLTPSTGQTWQRVEQATGLGEASGPSSRAEDRRIEQMQGLAEAGDATLAAGDWGLGRRSRNPGNGPQCQIIDCSSNLAEAKEYYKRHKVCEHHSKAAGVLHEGENQRYCQQCSRFHPLQEFDYEKRSCRRRLLGHNKRRRKSGREVASGSQSSPEKAVLLKQLSQGWEGLTRSGQGFDKSGVREEPAAAQSGLFQAPARARSPVGSKQGPQQLARTSSLPQFAIPRSKGSEAGFGGHSGVAGSLAPTVPPSGKSSSDLSRQRPSDQVTSTFPTSSQNEEGASDHSERTPNIFDTGLRMLQGLSAAHVGKVHADEDLIAAVLQQRRHPVPGSLTDSQLSLALSGQQPLAQHHQDAGQQQTRRGEDEALLQMQNLREQGRSGGQVERNLLLSLSNWQGGVPGAQSLSTHQENIVDVRDRMEQGRPTEHHVGTQPTLAAPHFPHLQQEVTGRVSMKLFNRNPADLPTNLREQVMDWLAQQPTAMESLIRPGCVLLLIYIRMTAESWKMTVGDLKGSLQRLAAGSGAKFWRAGLVTVQVGDKTVSMSEGVVQDLKPTMIIPRIAAIRPICVVAGHSEVVTVEGWHLMQTDWSLVIRARSHVEEQQSTDLDEQRLRTPWQCLQEKSAHMEDGVSQEMADLRLETQEEGNDEVGCMQQLSFKFSDLQVAVCGRAFVEMEHKERLLSNTLPLLVVPNHALCLEIRTLESSLGARDMDTRGLGECLHLSRGGWHVVHDLGWAFQELSRLRSSRQKAVAEPDGQPAAKTPEVPKVPPQLSAGCLVRLIAFASRCRWHNVLLLLLELAAELVDSDFMAHCHAINEQTGEGRGSSSPKTVLKDQDSTS